MIFIMYKMNVKFRKIRESAKTPTKGTFGSAGFDLYNSDCAVVLNPGGVASIKTGIQMEIPVGYAGFIYARSGLGCKYGIVPSNCVGVIDSDYRGEIIVCLYNHSKVNYLISHGDKIAQLVISAIPNVVLEEVSSLSETARNCDGFGSTGK